MPPEISMRNRIARVLLLAFLASGVVVAQTDQPANATSRPKVRTITAFVRLSHESYRAQVEDALKMLRAAKTDFTRAGYEVETIRITSQPFPEYTKDLSMEHALAFFRDYDKLAQQEGFTLDVGPAMSKDTDDPRQADLLAQILASTQSINSFIVVADDA